MGKGLDLGDSHKRSTLDRIPILLALFGLLPALVLAGDKGEPKPEPTWADLSYGPHGRNVFDFWKADAKNPTALVVYVHGGGFEAGDKNDADGKIVVKCLENGVSFAAVNYRFWKTTRLLDIMHDVARSIQYMRSQHKRFNIDKNRVAVYGISAGAGSSLWLAFHDDLKDHRAKDKVLRESSKPTVAGALETQATYDFEQWPSVLGMPREAFGPADANQRGLFGKAGEVLEDANAVIRIRKELDMLGHMDKTDPPVFLQCSADDVLPGDIQHHPRHGMAVKKRADTLGSQAVLNLKNTPANKRVDMLAYFFKHLGVR